MGVDAVRRRGSPGMTPIRRGDIWLVTLNPTVGREMQKHRPALVLSSTDYNRRLSPLVAPITHGSQAAHLAGFIVPLDGHDLRTDGVVAVHQARTLDLTARGARFVEHAPDRLTDLACEILAAIVEMNKT